MQTRRSLLRAGGVAAALSLAGCLGERSDPPEAVASIPDPAAFAPGSVRGFGSLDLSAFETDSSAALGLRDRLEAVDRAIPGIDVDDVDRVVGVGGGDPAGERVGVATISGSFDPEAVVRRLSQFGFARNPRDNDGYTVYDGAFDLLLRGRAGIDTETTSLIATGTGQLIVAVGIETDGVGDALASAIAPGGGYYRASRNGRTVIDAVGDRPGMWCVEFADGADRLLSVDGRTNQLVLGDLGAAGGAVWPDGNLLRFATVWIYRDGVRKAGDVYDWLSTAERGDDGDGVDDGPGDGIDGIGLTGDGRGVVVAGSVPLDE
ncbi:hypothetical protein BRD17_04535 [Halobacteriales archaeon SW_7_68_16]|nr:MAG: hypothetical protein BRD17_04535 [Halobacteriales archaeon SW_7_68_16]